MEPDEYDAVMADPITARYVHPYVGAHELLHGEKRWCLWLEGANPADITKSRILKKRVQAVRDFRANSKAASTREFAQYPTLFRQRAKMDTDYLCISSVVSGIRRYFTAARLRNTLLQAILRFRLPTQMGCSLHLFHHRCLSLGRKLSAVA